MKIIYLQQVSQIIEEAFQLLMDPGIKVKHENARNLLVEAGGLLDADTEVVKIPEKVARRALETDETSKTVPDDTSPQMHFRLSVIRDSVWIQVYSDGNSWRNIIYKNQHRSFVANDSFNIHVGNISCVKFSLDNKPVKVAGKGVVAFKVDHSGKAIKWSLSKWNRIFKDRT